jgi:hypothetical protein
MKLSSEKTEYCIFSRDKKDKEVINLKLGNHQCKFTVVCSNVIEYIFDENVKENGRDN